MAVGVVIAEDQNKVLRPGFRLVLDATQTDGSRVLGTPGLLPPPMLEHPVPAHRRNPDPPGTTRHDCKGGM